MKSIFTLKLFSVHSLISREYLIFALDAFYSNSKSTTSLVTSISERFVIPSSSLLRDLGFIKSGTLIGSLNFISSYPSLDISLTRGFGGGGGFSSFLYTFMIGLEIKASKTAFTDAFLTPGALKGNIT